MAKLTASPPTVIIDVEAGASHGTTDVSYEKERDHVLWKRTDFDAWVQRPISASSPNDIRHHGGTIKSRKLAPGAFYEMVVLSPDINANTGFDRAEAMLAVAALRKRPKELELISDWNEGDEGGTWCSSGVFTNRPVIALLQASTKPPRENADGFWSFDKVDGERCSDFGTSHDLEIVGLLPGTHFYELLRGSDEWGNWQFRQRDFKTLRRTFKTLRRTFTLNLVKIRIHDDSDDLSSGEGVFILHMLTGDGVTGPTGKQKWASVEKLEYHNTQNIRPLRRHCGQSDHWCIGLMASRTTPDRSLSKGPAARQP